MLNQVIPQIMDAAIYARYSGGPNQTDASIEQQIADCEIFARANNLRIVKIYADRHLSGTSDKRPHFQQMLKDAAHGKWKYVICWKIDRFARNRYDSATYKYRLKKNGVSVLYAKESIPDGPEGILLESILEGSAEYYSANLAQNVRRGMMYNAKQCKVTSGGIPFGYQKGADGKFEINPAQAEIVKEIFSQFLMGRSFAEIASELNSRGIRTARGNLWNRGSFHIMMRNEAYIGVYRYADVRIEHGIPQIIDPVQFQEVQVRLKTKKNPQGKERGRGTYLLTGKLKCAHCDSFMVGISGTSKHGVLYQYYGCQNHFREKTCTKHNVPRDSIERLVVKYTLDYVLQDEVIEWMADAIMEHQRRESASAQLDSLKCESSEVEKSINNVMAAIEAGIITVTTKNRLLELEARASELKNLIEIEQSHNTKFDREQIIYWFSKFKDGNINSQEFRRKIIDTFVAMVYLSDDSIKILFNFSKNNSPATTTLTLTPLSDEPDFLYKLTFGPPHSTIRTQAVIYFTGSLFVLEMPLS